MSKKRWWGLKMNGELILILPSQEPLTVDDFEHHDVPIDLNRTAKVVELDVRQKDKVKKTELDEELKEAYDKGFFAGQQKGWTEGVEYGKTPF